MGARVMLVAFVGIVLLEILQVVGHSRRDTSCRQAPTGVARLNSTFIDPSWSHSGVVLEHTLAKAVGLRR